MVKYYNDMVVFEEIPDEITLAINITNCPCHCKHCHSKFLWEDIGKELTYEALDDMVERNRGITCVCFMGGDNEPSYINELATHLRKKYPTLKVAWYSGREFISDKIDDGNFDYIKIGPYDDELGGLDKPTTNQRLYRIDRLTNGEDTCIIKTDITSRFWKHKV